VLDRFAPLARHPKSDARHRFEADPRAHKINLRTGVYKDDQGACAIWPCVKTAERRLLERETTKDYLDLPGHAGFRAAITELLLGSDATAETIHTPGGNAAMRLGGELLVRELPNVHLWVSDPTWHNHLATFAAAGCTIERYRWPVTPATALDADRLCEALATLPIGSPVLIQGCCHNPTGVDPTPDQWDAVARVLADRELFPIVDIAFLGYGDGLAADLRGLRTIADVVPQLMVTTSWSKSFCLYNERVGALTLVAQDAATATNALNHAVRCVRASYSNPPFHGAAIVAEILGDPQLRAEWEEGLAAVRERIGRMRRRLVDRMAALGVERDFSHVLRERSVFTELGLTASQVERLRESHAIYVSAGGGVNIVAVAGNELNRLCDAVAAVLTDK
jgi:aspartate/tyrosine/aromatic aminotransferase